MTRRMVLLTAVAANAAESEEQAARRRFHSVAAQAIALRKAVHSIEVRLEEQGFSLHPEIEMRRTAIDVSLDAAEELLERRQWKEAMEEARRAEGHVERLRQSL